MKIGADLCKAESSKSRINKGFMMSFEELWNPTAFIPHHEAFGLIDPHKTRGFRHLNSVPATN
jgi:hypothetical protein